METGDFNSKTAKVWNCFEKRHPDEFITTFLRSRDRDQERQKEQRKEQRRRSRRRVGHREHPRRERPLYSGCSCLSLFLVFRVMTMNIWNMDFKWFSIWPISPSEGDQTSSSIIIFIFSLPPLPILPLPQPDPEPEVLFVFKTKTRWCNDHLTWQWIQWWPVWCFQATWWKWCTERWFILNPRCPLFFQTSAPVRKSQVASYHLTMPNHSFYNPI